MAIRGRRPGDNFCACPDYATNELGTCKHIEFTLSRLEKKRGARTAFARGYHPPFSEMYLRNDDQRTIHFRAGTDCLAALREAATRLFEDALDFVAGRRDAARRVAVLDGLFPHGAADSMLKKLLKVPLPPPETAKKLADTLLLLSEALRGSRSVK